MKRIISVDTETTGLSSYTSEMLSISICDGMTGDGIFHRYYKPEHVTEWPDAQRVNGITPEMVSKCGHVRDDAEEIRGIIQDAAVVIVYNARFDMAFLMSAGCVGVGDELVITDPMVDFAAVYGEYNEYFGDYKWQKLTTAADYIDYRWIGNAHDSLADARAAAAVWRWLDEHEFATYEKWRVLDD